MILYRYAASGYGRGGAGNHGSPVSQHTWRVRIAPAAISSTPNTIGRWKRRGPIDPGLNTTTPASRPTKGTCECPHTS